MQNNLKKICVCQKKAVLLHPLLKSCVLLSSKKNKIAEIAQLVEQRIRNA